MQALFADIKLKLQADNYKEALQLCEKGVTLPDGASNIQLQGLRAQCAIHLNEYNIAEAALLVLIENSTTPQPQIQKTWKSLSDIYEQQSLWPKHIKACQKLYDINKQKGNTERVHALVQIIADAGIKIGMKENEMDSITNVLEFLSNHLSDKSLNPTDLSSTLKLIIKMNKIQSILTTIRQQINKNTISKTIKKDIHEYNLPTGQLLQTILMLLDRFDTISAIENEIFDIIMNELHTERLKLFHDINLDNTTTTNNKTTTSTTWLKFFQLCSTFMNISLIAINPDIGSYILEAWYFSNGNNDSSNTCVIVSYCEMILKTSPEHPWANIIKMTTLLKQGLCRPLRVHLPHLLKYYQESIAKLIAIHSSQKLTTPTDFTKQEMSRDPDIIKTIICLCSVVVASALDAFRGISSKDALHLTQEARRRLLNLQLVIGSSCGCLNDQLLLLVSLSRIRAISQVSHTQRSSVCSEAVRTLPQLFSSDLLRSNESDLFTNESIANDLHINFTSVTVSTIIIQRLFVQVLSSMRLFSHVIEVVDKILATGSPISSWLLSDRTWSQLLIAVDEHVASDRVERVDDVIVVVGLLRDVVLPSAAEGAVHSFQQISCSVDSLSSDIEAELKYRLGVAQWICGGPPRTEKSGCISNLMACVKLDATHSSVYSFIGHYYSIVLKDADRGGKCYMKALAADPLETESGVALSQLCLAANDIPRLQKLWSGVLSLTSHAYWCLSIKAQYHLCREELQEAVEGFQQALELNGDDAVSWHGLGVAYAQLRQDVAAQKALLKAVLINPENCVVQCVLADVQRRLCLLPDALTRYEDVVKKQPHNIIALKGIGEVCLALAFSRLTCGWTAGAASVIIRGVNAVQMALDTCSGDTNASSKYSCLWKLLGDMCCFGHHLSPHDVPVTSDTGIDCSYKGEDLLVDYSGLLKLLHRGEDAYREALSRAPSDSSPEDLSDKYYDVGVAAYYRAKLTLISYGQGCGLIADSDILIHAEITDLFSSASKAFHAGLMSNPIHAECWNGLGLCLRDDATTAQMCFVRAAQTGSSAAYANIGLVMVKHREEAIARECFSALQLMESNPLVWNSLGVCIEREMLLDNNNTNHNNIKKHELAIFDAYGASLEVTKPADALLGSSLSWLRLSGLLSSGDSSQSPIGSGLLSSSSISSSQSSTPNQFMIELRHEVEYKLVAFVRRRPLYPSAWTLLAQVREVRGAWSLAINACTSALYALEHLYTAVSGMGIYASEVGMHTKQKLESSLFRSILHTYQRCIEKAALFDGLSFQKLELSNFPKLSPLSIAYDQEAHSYANSGCFRNSFLNEIINGFQEDKKLDAIISRVCQALQQSLQSNDLNRFQEILTLICYFASKSDTKMKLCSPIFIAVSKLLLNRENDEQSSTPPLGSKADMRPTSSGTNSVLESITLCCCRALLACGEHNEAMCLLQNALQQFHKSVLLETLFCELNITLSIAHHKSAADVKANTEQIDRCIERAQSLMCSPVHFSFSDQDVYGGGSDKDVALSSGSDSDTPVRLYCRAVCLSITQLVQSGQCSEEIHRKHLKRALRLDPSDQRLWGTLAAVTYSDEALGGSRACSSDVRAHGEEAPALDMTCIVSAKLCLRILNHQSTVLGGIPSVVTEMSSSPSSSSSSSLSRLLLGGRATIEDIVATAGDAAGTVPAAMVGIAENPLRKVLRTARITSLNATTEACIMTYKHALNTVLDPMQPQIQTAAQSEDIATVSYVLWRHLGLLYNETGQAACAEFCFKKVTECLDVIYKSDATDHKASLLRTCNSIELGLVALRRYLVNNIFDDANRVRELMDICANCLPDLAVVNVLRAAVWAGLGKQPKVLSSCESARASWPQMAFPFSEVKT